jgi:hypothetical protein
MKYIALLIGALVISTALSAVETKENFSPTDVNKNSTADFLKALPRAHDENMVHDDYSLGRSPEVPSENIQGK